MPVCPFFGGRVPPTKIDCRKKGTLLLTSLLEDLESFLFFCQDSMSHDVLSLSNPRVEPFAAQSSQGLEGNCENTGKCGVGEGEAGGGGGRGRGVLLFSLAALG